VTNLADVQASHEKRFEELIVELAEALDVSADDLKELRHLVIDGVGVSLINYGVWDPGRITIVVDLGPIPIPHQLNVYRRLLEQNILLPRTFGTFAVIPDNGHGALSYSFDMLDKLNGKSLAIQIGEIIKEYASIEKSLMSERGRFDALGRAC
jgi:hypothetical protein